MNIGAFTIDRDSRHRHLPYTQQDYLRNQDYEDQYAEEYLTNPAHLPPEGDDHV